MLRLTRITVDAQANKDNSRQQAVYCSSIDPCVRLKVKMSLSHSKRMTS